MTAKGEGGSPLHGDDVKMRVCSLKIKLVFSAERSIQCHSYFYYPFTLIHPMTTSLQHTIQTALGDIIDPCLHKKLAETKTRIAIKLSETKGTIDLCFPYPLEGLKNQLIQEITEKMGELSSLPFKINLSWKIDAHAVPTGITVIAGVKNIIAVASGKGGVGKSTTALNLALSLQAEGARVGLLDADIYGPNQPQMLGVKDERPNTENNQIEPIRRFGLQTMSMGYLVDAQQPMIWRGPMVSSALMQLATGTTWKDLDYLIVDLPPGTGDIQLTLSQKIPVSGAVIVTTPQEVALADARKGLAMFRKVNVPILGFIENINHSLCKHCHEKEYIFGQGGGAKMAEHYDVPFLGEVPLLPALRESADTGQPLVLAEPESEIAYLYRELARSLAANLSTQPKNHSARLPKIVVE